MVYGVTIKLHTHSIATFIQSIVSGCTKQWKSFLTKIIHVITVHELAPHWQSTTLLASIDIPYAY